MDMSQHLKFDQAINFPRDYLALPEKVVPEIKAVTGNFVTNINRAAAPAGLLSNITGAASLMSTFDAMSRIQLKLVKDNLSRDEEKSLTDLVISKMVKHQTKILSDSDFAQLVQMGNIQNLNILIDSWADGGGRGATEMVTAIRSILNGIIIGGWTAFEVLAEDLWVACLNARVRLGFIALQAEPVETDDEATLERKQKIWFQFPIWKLRDPTFNVQHSMGDLLRYKWQFDRRESAADAYRHVFADDAEKEAVRKIFNSDKLKWLGKYRNNLVHDAGVATEEFEKAFAAHPILKDVKRGTEILVNGELANQFLTTALESGTALINFANEWLTTNKA